MHMVPTQPFHAFQKKPFFTTGLLVLGVFTAYIFLPSSPDLSGAIQSILFGIVFLVLVPLLYVKLVLKQPLSAIGFTWTARRYGLSVVFVSIVPLLSIWFLLLRLYEMDTLYSLPDVVRTSFLWFLFYQVVLVGMAVSLYEVFFRGLVMLSWLSATGIVSVFLQFGVFVLFTSLYSGLEWQNVPLLLAGLASGFVAYYTRSLWYSWMTAWLLLLFADVLFLVFG